MSRRRLRLLVAAVVATLAGGLAAGLIGSSGGSGPAPPGQPQSTFVTEVGAVCANADSRFEAIGKAVRGTSAEDYAHAAAGEAQIATSEALQLAAIRPPGAVAAAYRAWVEGFAAEARWSRLYAAAFTARDSAALARLSTHGPAVVGHSQEIKQRAAGLTNICNTTYNIVRSSAG